MVFCARTLLHQQASSDLHGGALASHSLFDMLVRAPEAALLLTACEDTPKSQKTSVDLLEAGIDHHH